MDKLSKEDTLVLEKFALRGQVLDLRCEAINRECAQFRAERDAHGAEIKAKYDLRDGDSLDLATGAITRAERAAEPMEVKYDSQKVKKLKAKAD